MCRYGNAAFNSKFHKKLKNKKWRDQFFVTKEFLTNICVRISFEKIERLVFCYFVKIRIQKKETSE